jgi:glycosyltransferase involved in cell wall biosynthesis
VKAPVLATLHLPRSFYDDALFRDVLDNVHFNCVSRSQAESFRDVLGFRGVVPNGIAVEKFRLGLQKEDYVLWLGRICPEKAPHLAIDAAAKAGVRLVMAGQVYPFSWHQLYFHQEIQPRLESLGGQVRWIKSPSFDEKVDLLSKAKALLLPTLAPETSSLVAMEAMASGTPLIAFPNGALPEIVDDEVGVLVNDVEQMSSAIRDTSQFSPVRARNIAKRRFSSRTMADGYEQLYRDITSANVTKSAA